ncbi:MAG: hypothetical protein Q9186_002323 [Xanthomendoza sp. 1 TL-2023]
MPVVQRGPMLSYQTLNTRTNSPSSVFESTYDNTEKKQDGSDTKRWKFQGPWLAGKTEGEFSQYLGKEIKQRRLDFRNFIRKRLTNEKTLDRRRKAQESGDSVGSEIKITEHDVDLYLKHLRRDEVRLYILIEDFLDLPISVNPKQAEGTFVATMDSDKGPPKTHLSAGLSYLRTASHMTNHPVLGPMEEEPPVKARILRPQVTNAVVKHYCALLGIGGVAADDVTMRTAFKLNDRPVTQPGIQRFDADTEGGAKLWVLPDRASIDPHGRLSLHILRVSRSDEAIYEGVVPEANVSAQPPIGSHFTAMPRLDSSRNSRTGSPSGYGLTVDGSGQSAKKAAPLDVPQGSVNSRQGVLNFIVSSNSR